MYVNILVVVTSPLNIIITPQTYNQKVKRENIYTVHVVINLGACILVLVSLDLIIISLPL